MSDQSHPEMSDAAFMPPPPPAPSMSLKATNTGNGRLTASGVLQIIEGALFAIFSLWLFSITQSQIGEFADDLTGGTITFLAVILLILSIALIWTAVMCIKARKGGWVSVVVFQSIFGVLSVLGIIGSAAEGNPAAGSVFVAAYCGIGVFLAVTGGTRSRS